MENATDLEYDVEDEEPYEPRIATVRKKDTVEDYYDIKEQLGKGRYGTVYRCIDKVSGKVWAAKYIRALKSKDKEMARNEIETMNQLKHPKLLQCVDAFETPNRVVMVIEFISGGELFERVVDDDFDLTEREVVMYMRQVCEGVQHMHQQNFLHLDLKPENIMCVDKIGTSIKLIDFGMAKKLDPDENVKVLFGTPEFVAPEVVNYERIGFPTDMWSLGVICYVLLSGLSPFMGDSDAETLNNVTAAEWDFEDEAFDDVSTDAKDFIIKLLVKRKENRRTIIQCLEHPWLARKALAHRQVNRLRGASLRLKRYMARRRWQLCGLLSRVDVELGVELGDLLGGDDCGQFGPQTFVLLVLQSFGIKLICYEKCKNVY